VQLETTIVVRSGAYYLILIRTDSVAPSSPAVPRMGCASVFAET